MTPLPKHLEEMRDELAKGMGPVKNHEIDEICRNVTKIGFDFCYHLMLADLESIAKALENWHSWEQEQIKKEGPYIGKAINELIKNASEAIKNYREKYEVKK